MPDEPNTETDRRAREAALTALAAVTVEPTTQIEYASNGRLLIVGDSRAWRVAATVEAPLQPVIVSDHPRPDGVAQTAPCFAPGGAEPILEGHLGDFRLELRPESGESQHLTADLVLDLEAEPVLHRAMNPPGYVRAGAGEGEFDAALAQLRELVGTFDKPRYFNYDPNICAQGRSGIKGCNRCVEVCPAEAITALAERVEVDPYLCQGGGACVSACPTGAITYAYPKPADSVEQLRALLRRYREAGGSRPVVLFVAEAERDLVGDTGPAWLLPVPIEELASVGIEVWLSALVFGADSVWLLRGPSVPAPVADMLGQQVEIANDVLRGLGLPAPAIELRDGIEPDSEPAVRLQLDEPATFAGVADKRQAFYTALDHLFAQAPAPAEWTALPSGAPFGRIAVDRDACTLCMGCTSVCPVHALQAGNERPALVLLASRCVQCGICAAACPEDAIALVPGVVNDPEQRRSGRVLHEEPAFECVVCGKPFATKSVIDNMLEKLSDHYMFQTDRARRRLMMCEDCRVVDAVQDDQAMTSGLKLDLNQ